MADIRAAAYRVRVLSAKLLLKLLPGTVALASDIAGERRERKIYAIFDEPYPYRSVLEMPPTGRVADRGPVLANLQDHNEPTISGCYEVTNPCSDLSRCKVCLQKQSAEAALSVAEQHGAVA